MAGYTPKRGILDEPTILTKAEYITYRDKRGVKRRRTLHPCGTKLGYQRHVKAREQKCGPCKEAHARARAEYRGTPYNGPAKPLAQCGTPSGARRHYKRGEPICFPCKIAKANHDNEYRQTRKAAGLIWVGPLAPPKDTGACGTRRGYQRHGYRHQLVCEACREANRVEMAERRRVT